MKQRAGKIISFVARWVIAIVGVTWVLSNIHLHDRIHVLTDRNLLNEVELVSGTEEGSTFEFRRNDVVESAPADRVIHGPDRKNVKLQDGTTVPLLGMRLIGDVNKKPTVAELLIKDPGGAGRFIAPSDAKDFALDVPQPRIERGAVTMVRGADRNLLLLALFVMPVTYICTTIRWKWLLDALGIVLPMSRVLVLNMVGAFYNTFMPGSTGGDVLKAYYAAKQAPTRRTAAVMSVIIDRIIGLLALIMLGGAMAAIQYATSNDRHDPVARACLRVALSAVVILVGTSVVLFVLYANNLRERLGINRLLCRLPLQDKLNKIIEVVRTYRERQMLMFWSLIVTFPVHITVVVSALLAGKAFGLPIAAEYYFIVVPVVVLVGALPLAPQGAGVMEIFAYLLTHQQGATWNQSLALTMSIRLLQIFWNLVGGVFVLRGGFQTPSDSEKAEMESANAPATQSPLPSPPP